MIGVILALVVAGCGGSKSPTTPSTGGDASVPDLIFCVDETNRYRTLAGVLLLTRSTQIEAFATAAAFLDSQTKTPHGYYLLHDPGPGAENEVIDWSIDFFGSVRTLMEQAIASYWKEGPNGPHYRNLTGPYASMGCGVKITGGLVTFVQDFRPVPGTLTPAQE